MDKGKFVDQLLPGTSFSHSVFIAVSPEIKHGKTGKPYAMFNIEDRTGFAAAKLWNITPDQEKTLFSNTYFLMSGEVDSGQYAGQVSINSIKPADEAMVRMDDFLAPLPEDHKFHYDRFIDLVKSVKNPYLKTLLRTVFGTPTDTLQKFRNAVAAKTMHHSHRGGLIEHSSEVAAMCDKMCDVLPGLNRDLLITCALLHDIGKLEEMEHGIHHGEYTPDGNLLGHIVLGTQIVLAGMGPDFPPKLRLGVMHLILSHHKTYAFGSPKEPMTAEAEVLAACDELSARVFQHRVAPKTARLGAMVGKTSNGFSFLGGYGEEIADAVIGYPATAESVLHFESNYARLPIVGTAECREVVLPDRGADYLLRVKDGGMNEIGILEGDLVFVNKDDNPSDGALVVVKIPGVGDAVRKLRILDGKAQFETGDGSPTPLPDISSVCGIFTGLLRES
jgi:3'-5' exoribonuclease